MKLFLTTLALTLAAATGQTNLEKIFRVDDPTLEYNTATNEFTMTTLFATGFNNPGADGKPSADTTADTTGFAFEVFDECPNGDHDYNGAEFVGEEVRWYTRLPNPNWMDDLTNNFNQESNDDVTGWKIRSRKAVTTFTINGDVGQFGGYKEVGNEGILVFCVRLGRTAETGADRTLVNFRQMLVTVKYNLLAGFDEIASFTTEAIEEVVRDDIVDEFTTTAEVCAGYGQPFNQGVECCITICPDAMDDPTAIMTTSSVVSLELLIDGAPNDAAQVVIFNGQARGGVVSGIDCDFDECCQVRFLMNGDFFAVGLSNAPDDTMATVTGSGQAMLTALPSARKLGSSVSHMKAGISVGRNKNRALQAEAATDYEAKFEVTRDLSDADGSDASSLLTVMNAAAVVGAAGAVAML